MPDATGSVMREKNTQKMGRSGSGTPKKAGPAVKSSPPSPNGSFPNAPSQKGRGKLGK